MRAQARLDAAHAAHVAGVLLQPQVQAVVGGRNAVRDDGAEALQVQRRPQVPRHLRHQRRMRPAREG